MPDRKAWAARCLGLVPVALLVSVKHVPTERRGANVVPQGRVGHGRAVPHRLSWLASYSFVMSYETSVDRRGSATQRESPHWQLLIGLVPALPLVFFGRHDDSS
ncbi:hypothetical protein F4779DRAFT_119985 [Xylariaceae sp. FL0662B]|nr:hypothetical protein F4779DRAFT_119985 [Xylariaceae sp. FL0662B]